MVIGEIPRGGPPLRRSCNPQVVVAVEVTRLANAHRSVYWELLKTLRFPLLVFVLYLTFSCSFRSISLVNLLHTPEICPLTDKPWKSPAQDSPSTPRHHHDRSLINVQPARMGDLQPKYAARIQHDDDNPDAHGWYAGMSKFALISVLFASNPP